MTTPARTSLVIAFNELVVERQYPDIHIADIIKRADVSRSTFYEHFGSKESLLRHVLASVLTPLAAASCGDQPVNVLERILLHFVDVKSVVDVYFRSPLLEIVIEIMGHELDNMLQARQTSKFEVPTTLIATQLASGTMGLIKAWLAVFDEVAVGDVARQVVSGSCAILDSHTRV